MPGVFNIETQTQDKWCWAAVSVSVARYFLPASTATQCGIASAVTTINNCCGAPDGCNRAEDLETALKAVQRYKNTVVGPLSFAAVQSEIDAHRPVCVRIGWRDGGGHFVVISGYQVMVSGAQQVEIADPFFANSTIDYTQFVSAYQSADQPGGGQWTHTFFVNG